MLKPSLRLVIEQVLGKQAFTQPRDLLLMQVTERLVEAKEKEDFYKLRAEMLRGEIKTLAAILMRRSHTTRIVLTQKEFSEIPDNLEVHVEAPEEGVRIYVLREIPAAKVIIN